MHMRTHYRFSNLLLYMLAALIASACLLPFWMVVASSLTSEDSLIRHGYTLWPRQFSATAYHYIIAAGRIIRGYRISFAITIIGTFLSLLCTTALAYAALSRKWWWTRHISFFVLVTILFNGGMVPWYLVCTKILFLQDTLWALIIPYLVNPWFFFLARNYFKTLPEALMESARIDGATDMTIFARIMLPMAVPMLAALGLFIALNYWNDWWLSLMLVEKDYLLPIQLLLRRMESNMTMLYQLASIPGMSNAQRPPAYGVRMATVVLTVGPIVFLYPFLQRFFITGITVGSIKG